MKREPSENTVLCRRRKGRPPLPGSSPSKPAPLSQQRSKQTFRCLPCPALRKLSGTRFMLLGMPSHTCEPEVRRQHDVVWQHDVVYQPTPNPPRQACTLFFATISFRTVSRCVLFSLAHLAGTRATLGHHPNCTQEAALSYNAPKLCRISRCSISRCSSLSICPWRSRSSAPYGSLPVFSQCQSPALYTRNLICAFFMASCVFCYVHRTMCCSFPLVLGGQTNYGRTQEETPGGAALIHSSWTNLHYNRRSRYAPHTWATDAQIEHAESTECGRCVP